MTAGTATMSRWPLDAPPADYALGHVRAVTATEVLDDARVVVRDGRIAAVEPHPPGASCDVDGAGLLCMPGLIDTHSDGLERERLPRPGAELDWDFALISFEGKLRAAGITTAFHGAGFERARGPGSHRSVEAAGRLCAAVTRRGPAPVDHRILHRLDVRCPDGLAALRARLDASDGVALVSHEDHTPGQGQYADRSQYERFLMGTQDVTAAQARAQVDRTITERDGRLSVRNEALRWLGNRARHGAVRLLGHDPATAAEIDALVARGGSVAEFPTTEAAARAARDRGLPVVAGAPNVLRGQSHSGNVSAAELVRQGLVTALASDFLPAGLLGAAFLLAEQNLLTLPAAVRLVTAGPAEAAGLHDRGRLAGGYRADLALAQAGQPWPVPRGTLRA